MIYSKSGILTSAIYSHWKKWVLSLTAITTLTACPVDSNTVADENLIAMFLVQNDNGQASTTVTFTSRDLAGTNDVDLVAGESIWYQNSDDRGELDKRSDGEYTAILPSAAADIYSFELTREPVDSDQTENRLRFFREISDNHAYLPEPFQSVQAELIQFGPTININWLSVDSSLQLIDGFVIDSSEDSFNAIATCQAENDSIDLAISEGSFAQQNGMTLLEIPVTDNLQDVAGLSPEVIAVTSCEFNVQLVRTANGVTDELLSRRSTATGQVLLDIAIQWAGQ